MVFSDFFDRAMTVGGIRQCEAGSKEIKNEKERDGRTLGHYWRYYPYSRSVFLGPILCQIFFKLYCPPLYLFYQCFAMRMGCFNWPAITIKKMSRHWEKRDSVTNIYLNSTTIRISPPFILTFVPGQFEVTYDWPKQSLQELADWLKSISHGTKE